MSNNNYYSKKYIPSITKWGKGTLLLGIVLCFAPLIVVSGIFGYMPPIAAIIAGTISQISVSGAFYIVEPIAYFPILGIPGTYMTFISGNTSNMRVPCAMVAQEAADVEPGTEKGSVISTIGIAVSIIVNIIILSVGVVFGQAILSVLPPQVTSAFDLILPALFGAVFGQFAIMKPKFAAVSAL
ncbi:putative membrane protein [[Clostridium] sordellii ATCC 9714]|nr:putative membrane protein [[Clostridium] sordellii ATCC 9714] [Paeniclostridium sordellii ATCC 9714]